MSDSACGISALVRLAGWLEDRLGMEILGIGRDENCFTLEIFGKHLFYAIVVDPEKLRLLAQTLESPYPVEPIVSVGDDREGFKTLSRLLRAFERNNVTSLNRPIELGEAGSSEGSVIGD